VAQARAELASVGCTVLENFARPQRCDELRAECARIAPRAYYQVETVNAYNIDLDTPLPAGHPGRRTMKRGNAFVARDLIPEEFIIARLYTSPAFQRFVADCFALDKLHPLGDKLSGLVLNVVKPGMEHPWHFDTNEFTISMLTQQAHGGGIFQYCPNIRSAEAENFDDVRAVLDGQGDHLVRRLTLRPGDLQLFTGRYSLHRVSRVEGSLGRHTAIFAYSKQPEIVGSVARTRQLFGRALPQHRQRSVRVDQLPD